MIKYYKKYEICEHLITVYCFSETIRITLQAFTFTFINIVNHKNYTKCACNLPTTGFILIWDHQPGASSDQHTTQNLIIGHLRFA